VKENPEYRSQKKSSKNIHKNFFILNSARPGATCLKKLLLLYYFGIRNIKLFLIKLGLGQGLLTSII